MIRLFRNRKTEPSPPPPPPQTDRSVAAWGGIVGLAQSLINAGAFGVKYPKACPNGQGAIGTDEEALSLAVRAEIPGIEWPLATTRRVYQGFWSEVHPYAPEKPQMFAFIEFCHRNVAKPVPGAPHNGHRHLDFDEADGKRVFREDINRIFSSNNLPYRIDGSGRMVEALEENAPKSLPPTVQLHSGNTTLNHLLEEARSLYLDPNISPRSRSIHCLWDCWQRLSEHLAGNGRSLKSVLAGTDPAFRPLIEEDILSLTTLGHTLRLGQVLITDPVHIDYLFHRFSGMIRLLLAKCGTPEQ